MGERGSLGHSLPDTLAQICFILIKETHFLHLTVHSERQTSCNLGFREECLYDVCAMPQNGWEEKRSKCIQVVALLKQCAVCMALHVPLAEDIKVFIP